MIKDDYKQAEALSILGTKTFHIQANWSPKGLTNAY